MAGAGAHLTSTVAEDETSPPSIFDVLAQENLVTSLRPALKYMLRILAERNPARFGWLYGLGDELFSLLDLIVEHYYLRHYSASFAENFYGMKRVSIRQGLAKLPKSALVRSLAFLVLLPYLKDKCENAFERMRDAAEQGRYHNIQPWKKKLYTAFLAVYPYLHCTYEGSMFMFQMAYVFGKIRYHSPLLKLAGVKLCNLTEEDIELQGLKQAPMSLAGKTLREQLSIIVSRLIGGTAIALSSALSVGVFFLQFLEWWYASDQHAASITALPVPDPPRKREDGPRLHSLCPLCKKLRTNDTALAVTGYVFCYPCIYNYVRQNACCPVTGYPANGEQLVKLYLED